LDKRLVCTQLGPAKLTATALKWAACAPFFRIALRLASRELSTATLSAVTPEPAKERPAELAGR
jgi:hypothetical protein